MVLCSMAGQGTCTRRLLLCRGPDRKAGGERQEGFAGQRICDILRHTVILSGCCTSPALPPQGTLLHRQHCLALQLGKASNITTSEDAVTPVSGRRRSRCPARIRPTGCVCRCGHPGLACDRICASVHCLAAYGASTAVQMLANLVRQVCKHAWQLLLAFGAPHQQAGGTVPCSSKKPMPACKRPGMLRCAGATVSPLRGQREPWSAPHPSALWLCVLPSSNSFISTRA